MNRVVYAVFLAIALPLSVFAQEPADISITMAPSDPKPFEQVTLEAKSFGVDLSQATLTWSYDGQLVSSGVGRTKAAVVAPGSGATSIVLLTASGAGFADTSATLVIRPASVDVLWEASDAYTPPFYKGKALPSTGGLIRVVAIPSPSAPKGLSYQWTRNGSAMLESSGYGQSSVLIKNNSLHPSDTVAATVRGGLFVGSGSTTVTARDPALVAYRKENGFINYANGFLNGITSNDPGLVLHFEPYYFSIYRSLARDLSFDFSFNGSLVSGDPQVNELRLSRPDGGGQSDLKIAITTIDYSLQQLAKTFTILFN